MRWVECQLQSTEVNQIENLIKGKSWLTNILIEKGRELEKDLIPIDEII